MQFFRSCFRERGSPNGEDFYPQTRRFPAAILGGSQGEATQYTDKKTAQAVCNAYENGFTGAADSAPVLYYNHPASKIQP